MADTSFVDQSSTQQGTGIVAAWLNAVNKWLFWGRRPNIATTTGSANAQVLTLEAGSLYVAGSEADGDEFWLTAGFTNTGAMTLQVLAPSGANVARAVQLNGQALTGGEVQSGTLYKVQRLGTTWQLAASKQILFAGLTAQRTVTLPDAATTMPLATQPLTFSGPTAARTYTLPDANLTIPAVTAKGDTLSASGSGVLVKNAVGADGQALIADSTQAGGVKWGSVPLRSYLAGLTLSTAGSSTTMTTAAGQATDGGNVTLMTLPASIAKTTGAWTVGSAQGGLDTGAIANSTWYHFWLIQRTDTSVVDVLISLSATAPTMPANYTLKRRIGSGKTDGGGNWTAFIQDGDFFQWLATVLDVNATNPGTSAVTRTLTVPTGVSVIAQTQLSLINTGVAGASLAYLSDLAVNDEVVTTSIVDAGQVAANAGNATQESVPKSVRTNTSAQIRSRISFSDASCILHINTLGWIDRRGRDA